MWLAVCADPDCPNKKRVEELEAEVRVLREKVRQLADDLQAERYKRTGEQAERYGGENG